ncbi:MAG: hypothetical protein ACREOJ_08070 [Gemmatimonadaceae bacterium]
MNPPLPPYSLEPHRFPLRALAALAARAPLGNAHEVTLACLMAANLAAHQSLAAPLPQRGRADRAAKARGWFAARALPGPVRTALGRLLDTLSGDSLPDVAAALTLVLSASRRYLDAASIRELETLSRALAAGHGT